MVSEQQEGGRRRANVLASKRLEHALEALAEVRRRIVHGEGAVRCSRRIQAEGASTSGIEVNVQ